MMRTLKVFEHQCIHVGERLLFYKNGIPEEMILEQRYIDALWQMYDEKKRPFFKPSRKGIRFCEYVGVLKILDLTIEILPKADRNTDYVNEHQQDKWQWILLDMLRVCRLIQTPSASEAPLKLRHNSILDLYIQYFIIEVNRLLHNGLIRKYRREEINSTSLKGKLLLSKHIRKNIVHREKFFVSRTSYDRDHLLHQVIFRAIKILPIICNNQALLSICCQLQLNFPEVSDLKVDEGTFDNLVFDRKSEGYQQAIQIAKLLLLNYRPDVISGRSHAIAILFNMNQLWEEYIYRMLNKANIYGFKIHNQKSTVFWRTESGSRSIKPDIVIEAKGKKIVIDTKWKNLHNDVRNVKMDDLRQMYAYNHYFDAVECFLLYPGEENKTSGDFSTKSYFKDDLKKMSCGVVVSRLWKDNDFKKEYLDMDIGTTIFKQLKLI